MEIILKFRKFRAKQLTTAFGRMGGNVVGFIANNSAFTSGNIDTESSRKGAKFIRFCNLYNIPVIFLEDVSGYAPGSEQERAGVVQAGRELLDAIVDLRVPRLTLIVRNAFGRVHTVPGTVITLEVTLFLPCQVHELL